jgi:hypothetical protein
MVSWRLLIWKHSCAVVVIALIIYFIANFSMSGAYYEAGFFFILRSDGGK